MNIPGMPARDLKIWAREEILESVDAMVNDALENGRNGERIDLEDELVLKKERDRVAKFLNLPTKWS